MQRFKNLTKKSGKVASAILSAAMVTSMVLGTNVVEVKAATNNAETTADVAAAPTVNKDYEQVQAAIAEITAAVKDFPVTTETTGNEEDFTDVNGKKKDIEDKYNVTIGAPTLTQTGVPTETKTGETKVVYTVTSKGSSRYVNNAVIKYTLANFTDRAAAAKAAVDEKIQKIPAVNLITKDDFVDEAKKALNKKVGKHGSIKVYGDIATPADADVTDFDVDWATGNENGKAQATLKVTAADATTSVSQTVRYNKTIDNNQTRVNQAKEKAEAYLKNELRIADSTEWNDGTDAVKDTVKAYLDSIGYTDVIVATTPAAVSNHVNAESQNVDGTTEVSFRLQTEPDALKDADAAQTRMAETKDYSVTLLSQETKAKKALADLMKAADKVENDKKVDNDTDETAYGKAFSEAYNDLFEDYNKTAARVAGRAGAEVTTANAISVTTGAANTINNLANVYGTQVSASYVFKAKDGSASKDGDPTAIFTVKYDNETFTATKEYKIASAQSTVDGAKAAVEKALADMTVTNDTTQADVEAVVNAAIKDYDGVKVEVVFDKTNNATADKEGKADISVKLTDERNNITKEATATKTIVFLSNTFVEKDGKKFYYDKNGKLLKNTFLQGTDSPDGYTYYIQNDGSVMQDRLTYHPNGKDVIYFDAEGHEVFDAFVNVKKDVQGNAVDYIGYFGTLGGAYVNQTTYGNGVGAYSKDALFYINDYGVLENKGWFQNAAGNIGYAAANGTLTTSQWSLDQFGRKVYFQANGFLAKGLMTDGVKTYQLDETDGHLVGEF